MPITKTIAKKDFYPVFKKGDSVTIVPILYEEDTLLVNEIHGVFKNDKLVKFYELTDLLKKDEVIKKIFDAVYAPKGSYKDSYIETEDRRKYPSSLVRNYQDYFEKI